MTRSQKGKVYEGVLDQLKSYIEYHHLKPGDKLPSERELSEQLNVGRSSIREALRAMELLGLIETRRGEGTFMRAYRPHHMVELLSNFLLNESRTREELFTAKQMLEKEVVMRLLGKLTEDELNKIDEIIEKEKRHEELFQYLFERSGQHLLLSMWQFIYGFTHTVHDIQYEKSWYHKIVQVLRTDDRVEVLHLFSS
ncbi:FadR/GntR family transcriptional regulator [Halobacillus sp. BBL2006]|uniref:FadR/GntR family transcriptional regulator n=1 Tax=Halobacillus sp. BBL2006 TaxID=1543706 RepID=UPI00054233B4|nr:GntR family transcriptional regulator [Halobacillus sp. BBL2006]KHE72411.1 GntR family transcriptional regulator [Halobacillus sp. BBL2006]